MYDDMNVAFVGSGRCFHTNDWYRSALHLLGRRIPYITDNYTGDGLPSVLLPSDDTKNMLIIDRLLFEKASTLGHRWRNILKLALAPIQVILLRRHWRKAGKPFLIAHSTYYAFLASFTGAAYSATPQGSEVLVRPKAGLYRYLLLRSFKYACFITVDSVPMKTAIESMTDRPVFIVQNGIDVAAVSQAESRKRNLVLSIRGMAENYRIREILAGRNAAAAGVPLTLIFPFSDEPYLESVRAMAAPTDTFLGRVGKDQLFTLVANAVCVISIPTSDSSPRSIYEAIFGGAAVMCTSMPFVDALPVCMRTRIIIVDLADETWFDKGLVQAKEITQVAYVPSEEALSTFDQLRSMQKYLELIKQFTTPLQQGGKTMSVSDTIGN